MYFPHSGCVGERCFANPLYIVLGLIDSNLGFATSMTNFQKSRVATQLNTRCCARHSRSRNCGKLKARRLFQYPRTSKEEACTMSNLASLFALPCVVLSAPASV